MPWRRRTDVDEVVRAIRQNANELRQEARKVELSHERMNEIADHMEALVQQLKATERTGDE